MSDKSTGSTNGIGFTGLLTIVFVIFKVLGKIAWSWWWVFSPIWISAALVIFILAMILIVATIAAALD